MNWCWQRNNMRSKKATSDHCFNDVHDAAVDVLCQGMIDLGLLQGDLNTIKEQELYKEFYMHKTSHWLGMDVHDVGDYFVDGKSRMFEPGSC